MGARQQLILQSVASADRERFFCGTSKLIMDAKWLLVITNAVAAVIESLYSSYFLQLIVTLFAEPAEAA